MSNISHLLFSIDISSAALSTSAFIYQLNQIAIAVPSSLSHMYFAMSICQPTHWSTGVLTYQLISSRVCQPTHLPIGVFTNQPTPHNSVKGVVTNPLNSSWVCFFIGPPICYSLCSSTNSHTCPWLQLIHLTIAVLSYQLTRIPMGMLITTSPTCPVVY